MLILNLSLSAFACALIHVSGGGAPEPVFQHTIRIRRGAISYHHTGGSIPTSTLVQTLRDEPTAAFRHILALSGLLSTSRRFFYEDGYKSPANGYCVLGQLSVFLQQEMPDSAVRSLSREFPDNLQCLPLYGQPDINKFFVLFLDTRSSSQPSSPYGSPFLNNNPTHLSPSSLPLTLKRTSPDIDDGTRETRRRVSLPHSVSSEDAVVSNTGDASILAALAQHFGQALVERATFNPPARTTGMGSITTYQALVRFMALEGIVSGIGLPSLFASSWDARGQFAVVQRARVSTEMVYEALGWSSTTINRQRLQFGRSQLYAAEQNWPQNRPGK